MPKQLWPWSPNTVTITQKSTGSASPHWTAFRGPTNRPHGHTHEEAHFWQNMARKQGGWAGADEVIRREEKRRNRATRAAEHTGKENPTHPGKTVTLSVAMASSSFYHQGLVRTFPPVPREIPASEWLLPAHKDFPPLPSPQCSLWGHLQGRSESWAGIIEPHPRQFRNEALQPESCSRRRNRTWQPWVIPPTPFLSVLHNFSFSEFYVQPAIKTGKTSKVLHTPQNADLSILLII